jgi:hypothetical protein
VQSFRHDFGESNAFADFASRGRIVDIHLLAEQMGVRAVEVPPAEMFNAVLDRFRKWFGPKPSAARPGRPVIHSTSASLGAVNMVADKVGHKGHNGQHGFKIHEHIAPQRALGPCNALSRHPFRRAPLRARPYGEYLPSRDARGRFVGLSWHLGQSAHSRHPFRRVPLRARPYGEHLPS